MVHFETMFGLNQKIDIFYYAVTLILLFITPRGSYDSTNQVVCRK